MPGTDDLYDTVQRAIANYVDAWESDENLHLATLAVIDAMYNWQLANGYIIKAPWPPEMKGTE